jgi:hypothetical protein
MMPSRTPTIHLYLIGGSEAKGIPKKNLVLLVKFLYSKQPQKSKASSSKMTKIASFSGLVHDNLVSDMDPVAAKKESEKEMSEAVYKYLLKASAA